MWGSEYPDMAPEPRAAPTPTFHDNSSPAFQECIKPLSLSKEEATVLEKDTSAQSGSPLWWEQRRKRLTDSFYGEICKRKNKKSDKLVARMRKPPVKGEKIKA